MKSLITTLLPFAVYGAVIQQRSPAPQAPAAHDGPSHASAAPMSIPGLPMLKLGPNGLPDLTGLQGFDLARLAPIFASVQPYFGRAVSSGMLAGVANMFIPTIKLKNKVVLEPKLRKSAKRIKARIGPYTLAAKGEKRPSWFSYGNSLSLDPNGQSFVSIVEANAFCTNCTVLSGQTGVEFEDGSPADATKGVYIHHIISIDLSREGRLTVLPCDFEKFNYTETPISPIIPGAGFVGQGEDNGEGAMMFTTRDGKFDSGFQIGTNDKFLVQSDLVNYNNRSVDVYLTFDLEYVEGQQGLEAVANILSVTGCKIAEPKVSKDGPAETVSQQFPVLVDGTAIYTKGHMHAGGEKVVLYLNGKEICTSKAVYDETDMISGMTGCEDTYRVKKGDTITLKSVYDIVKHPMRSGSHGGNAGDVIGGHDIMALGTMSIAMDKEQKST